MDSGTNPFNGTPGAMPRQIVGRSTQLAMIDDVCRLLSSGSSERPLAVAGLRGMGVTTVLRAATERAESLKWMTSLTVAGLSGHATVTAALRRAVEEFAARRPGFSKLAQIRDIVAGYEAVPTTDPEHLADCLVALGSTLEQYASGTVCFIDDAHHLGDDLAPIARGTILAMEHSRPATIVLGGLPMPLPGFHRIDIGPLRPEQIETLLVGENEQSPEFHRSAIGRIQSLSRGVPFLVQAFAAHAWTAAERLPVVGDDVDLGRKDAQDELIDTWYRPTLEGLSGGERRYLRAVADLGGHEVAIAEVGRRLGDTTRFSEESSALTAVRRRLMQRSMLWTVDEQRVSFAIPEFGAFLNSSM